VINRIDVPPLSDRGILDHDPTRVGARALGVEDVPTGPTATETDASRTPTITDRAA
jgi:hypothetical protein